MKRFAVSGHATVTVVIEVDAESKEEAIKKAAAEFEGIKEFCGNGGTDKLIGVDGEDESIAADEEVEFDDCWEVEV